MTASHGARAKVEVSEQEFRLENPEGRKSRDRHHRERKDESERRIALRQPMDLTKTLRSLCLGDVAFRERSPIW